MAVKCDRGRQHLLRKAVYGCGLLLLFTVTVTGCGKKEETSPKPAADLNKKPPIMDDNIPADGPAKK